MTPVAKAGSAGLLLVLAPFLPLAVPTAAAFVVYGIAVLLLLSTIVDACRDSYVQGFRAGERAHRLSTMAEVIRLPIRRSDRSAS